MLAYANPAEGNNQATGHGLVRFKKSTRQITMECWPRFVDVTNSGAKQFAGWPLTIRQEDNYGRRALAWLPELVIQGQTDPVVQVIDEQNGEVVYTIRIKGTRFRPKVFREGMYTLKVGGKAVQGVQSIPAEKMATLEVVLR
jgi:hypothetical protein